MFSHLLVWKKPWNAMYELLHFLFLMYCIINFFFVRPRCLVKNLESLILSYDLTVRDNGGGVVQFLYGDDGVDVGKSSFLERKQFDFLLDNLPVRYADILLQFALVVVLYLAVNHFHLQFFVFVASSVDVNDEINLSAPYFHYHLLFSPIIALFGVKMLG